MSLPYVNSTRIVITLVTILTLGGILMVAISHPVPVITCVMTFTIGVLLSIPLRSLYRRLRVKCVRIGSQVIWRADVYRVTGHAGETLVITHPVTLAELRVRPNEIAKIV